MILYNVGQFSIKREDCLWSVMIFDKVGLFSIKCDDESQQSGMMFDNVGGFSIKRDYSR